MHKEEDDEEINNEGQDGDEQNDLRTENELKRIKLSLEHGADFSLPEDANVPPEVESVWLDYIQKFEDEFAKDKKTTVYEFIGSPEFRPVAEIPDEEIEASLDKLRTVMGKNNVILDTICDVDEREMYRFITEELFFHKTTDIRIEGMKHCFIYEEFHPNHEYDIKNHCIDFVNSVLNKEKDWMPDFLALAKLVTTTEGAELTTKQAIEKMELFRDAFSGFDIKQFEIESININGDMAYVSFQLYYTAFIEGSNDSIVYSGPGNLLLVNEDGYWCISKINMPGMVV